MTDTTIVASGDIAASPRTENIVDVPAYVPEAETPEAKVGATPDTTAEQSPEAKAEDAKKPNGFKAKLDRERAKVAELQAKLDAAAPKEQPKTQTAEAGPKPEDFETWDAYYKADAKYQARQEYTRLEQERSVKDREASQKTELADKQKQYAERADEFKESTPDFDEVIDSYNGPLTALMQQALLDSDIGPQVAYYLAQNPEEGEAMAEMGVLALGKAIGRIEAKLEVPTVDTMPKPAKELKTTKAPPPITPVGKSSTNSAYDPHSSKGRDDHEDYMKWRAKNR